MRVAVYIPGSEHEASAQLERIRPYLMLPVPARLGAFAGRGVVGTQQMKNVGGFQACHVVGQTLGVHQQGKLNAGLLPERIGIMRIAESHRGQLCPACFELRGMLAQLRDVLPAEDSTIVP